MAYNQVAIVARHLSEAVRWAQEKGYTMFSSTMWRDELGRMQCYVKDREDALKMDPVLVIALPSASHNMQYYQILEIFTNKNVPITYL